VGTIVITIGLALLSTMTPGTARWEQFVFMAIVGLGIGSVMQVYVLASQNAVEMRDLGTATSIVSFFRSMGGAFGVAIYGAIFNSRLADGLTGVLPPDSNVSPDALRGSPDVIRSLPDQIRSGVVDAFADAVQGVFRVAIPIAVAGVVLALVLRELPLKEHAHVTVPGDAPQPEIVAEPLV
jgi:MFS family permease